MFTRDKRHKVPGLALQIIHRCKTEENKKAQTKSCKTEENKRHRLKVEKQSLRLTIKQSKSSACELLIITHRFNWGCRDSASNIEDPRNQVRMIFSIALSVFLYQNQ